MNIFKKLAVSGLVLAMAPLASAGSISGSTDFKVSLPEILVLYHWDEAHLTLTADNKVYDDATVRTLSSPVETTAVTFAGGDVTTATVPTGTSDTSVLPNEITVTLQNAWAVRSLSSGEVKLKVETQNSELKLDGTSASDKITVGAPTLKSVNISANDTISIPSGWTPISGDIDFTLNLANANKAGIYKTASAASQSTDTFLLTLTGATNSP